MSTNNNPEAATDGTTSGTINTTSTAPTGTTVVIEPVSPHIIEHLHNAWTELEAAGKDAESEILAFLKTKKREAKAAPTLQGDGTYPKPSSADSSTSGTTATQSPAASGSSPSNTETDTSAKANATTSAADDSTAAKTAV